MGLDWCLARKVHEDHAARAEKLEAALDDEALTDKNRDALIAQLEEITESPEETLRAPKVGLDEAATEWFRDLWEEQRERVLTGKTNAEADGVDWTRSFEEILAEAKGAPVVQLTDYVLPSYVGSDQAGPLSFDGRSFTECEDLPRKLLDEAWEHHTPKEALAFATRIEKVILRVLKKKIFAPLAKKYDRLREKAEQFEDDDEVIEWQERLPKADREVYYLSVAFEAVAWLRFWGERGHGFEAVF